MSMNLWHSFGGAMWNVSLSEVVYFKTWVTHKQFRTEFPVVKLFFAYIDVVLFMHLYKVCTIQGSLQAGESLKAI